MASTDIIVPLEQEGTTAKVVNWLKAVGDSVAANEAVCELETDKVTVEVPSPAAGVLGEILLAEGADAAPGAVLARLRDGAARAAPAGKPDAPVAAKAPTHDAPENRHSPAVRKALAETGVDPAAISGSGRDGRLTLADVKTAAKAAPEPAPAAQAPVPKPAPAPATGPTGAASQDIPHDRMRLNIARNMVASMTEAPQVTAVFEADFSAIQAHRAAHKAGFAADGANLTYMPYIVQAIVAAMRKVPQVNSRWHDDRLQVFSDVNIGIGTALADKGLVVPVLHRAQDLSLKGIATRLTDMTDRARAGRLAAADMQGGTFTISNHGTSGSLLAAPIIIHAGQAAILGIGKLEKHVVVREIGGQDAILIRPMAYVTLTIDHRVLDGFASNAWLTEFVATLEGWPAA